jgi:hypothetical protein
MRLFLDIDTREFLQSPSFPRALTTLALKRRDTDLIELQFVRDRVVQDLPTGTTIRLGLKPANSYTAEFLATGTFTKDGTGTATRYLLDLNLNTVPLNEAFAASTPEPVTLAAMLEVEWTSGTNISSSLTLPVTIANDVIRGDEGEPVDLPIFYITETNDLQATQAEAEAGANNTKWMSPLRTAEAIAALAATDWDSIADKPDAFPPSTHTHAISDTTGLQAALDGKASSSHTHAISDTTGLQAALDGKQAAGSFAPADHTHELSSLTQSSASTGQVVTWDGSAWVPESPGAGGGVSSWNDLTDKPSTFPPDAHAHGNITTAGAIGTTSGVPILTGTGGVLQAGSFGTTAGTFAEGDNTHTGFVTASGGITSIAVVPSMPADPDESTLYIVVYTE